MGDTPSHISREAGGGGRGRRGTTKDAPRDTTETEASTAPTPGAVLVDPRGVGGGRGAGGAGTSGDHNGASGHVPRPPTHACTGGYRD